MRRLFFLCVWAVVLLTGCFDSSPPPGITGQLVGCFDTNTATFCITEYPRDVDTPPLTTTPATFADVVSSVGNGSKRYSGQTLTVTAEVGLNLDTGAITLQTNNDDVTFYITDYDNPDSLADFEEGETYTFTLYIRDITLSKDFSRYLIWSNEVD